MVMLLFSLALGAAPVPPLEAAPKPAKICRESVKQTGSHIRTGRRCKTAEEWARIDGAEGGVVPTLRTIPSQGDGVQVMTRPQ